MENLQWSERKNWTARDALWSTLVPIDGRDDGHNDELSIPQKFFARRLIWSRVQAIYWT